MPRHRKSTGTTDPGCAGCRLKDCPVEHDLHGSPPGGWRLGLALMGLFLGPIVLAIVGAMCVGEGHSAQLAGAAAGLALGIAVSVAAARRLRPNNGGGAPSP